jgi:glutamate carboxypeptidase
MFDVQEYLQDLETLVSIDSDSYNVEGVNAVGSFFADRFERIGWKVERIHLNEAVGNLLNIQNDTAIRHDVLIIGHMDTVFPKGEAARRPFRVEDGRAYGPGVADMKCGVLATWYALKELSDAASNLSIRVIMNPDEEIHSPYSTAYIEEAAKRADRVFVMEPAMVDGAFCIERKGRLDYVIEFYGVSIHAGYRWERPHASAIDEMALWINELNQLGDKELDTTVNVGRVAGGTMSNVVADRATMYVESRMWSQAEAQRVKDAIGRRAASPFIEGVTCTIASCLEKQVLTPTQETLDFTAMMESLYHRRGLPFAYRRCGGVSDANAAGVHTPVTVDRIGPWGDNNHSDKEFMVVESAEHSVRLLQAMLDTIASKR